MTWRAGASAASGVQGMNGHGGTARRADPIDRDTLKMTPRLAQGVFLHFLFVRVIEWQEPGGDIIGSN